MRSCAGSVGVPASSACSCAPSAISAASTGRLGTPVGVAMARHRCGEAPTGRSAHESRRPSGEQQRHHQQATRYRKRSQQAVDVEGKSGAACLKTGPSRRHLRRIGIRLSLGIAVARRRRRGLFRILARSCLERSARLSGQRAPKPAPPSPASDDGRRNATSAGAAGADAASPVAELSAAAGWRRL